MEFMCGTCGKTVYLGWDARGCEVMCESCAELNAEADKLEMMNGNKIIKVGEGEKLRGIHDQSK